MAEDSPGKHQRESCLLYPNTSRCNQCIITECPAMFLNNTLGNTIACMSLIQENRGQLIDTDGYTLLTAGKMMEYFFDRVQMKKVKYTRSECCWWFNPKLRAVHGVKCLLPQM